MPTLLQEPRQGDDRAIVVRRWVLKLAVPALIAAAVFIANLSARVTKLEQTPESPKVAAMEVRLEQIEEMVKLYEQIRPQRERELAVLKADAKNTKDTIDQMRAEMNDKLNRLLFGQRR